VAILNREDGVRAIILSAGQGSRLLPHTATLPKCLVEVSGRAVLEWQLRALRAAGVDLITVVVGFEADKVETHLAQFCPSGLRVRTLFNPLYARADNLVSCLAARGEMTGDFLLLNGDTLFEPAAVTLLRGSELSPVSIAVASKSSYDADDMKVSCKAGKVWQIGKTLPTDQIDGEAIGISLFRGQGPRLFVDALESIAQEKDAHRRWYLSAVNQLAGHGFVSVVSVDDVGWTEIDFPADLERAESLVARWQEPRSIAEARVAAGDSF
jgi:choline kinase